MSKTRICGLDFAEITALCAWLRQHHRVLYARRNEIKPLDFIVAGLGAFLSAHDYPETFMADPTIAIATEDRDLAYQLSIGCMSLSAADARAVITIDPE